MRGVRFTWVIAILSALPGCSDDQPPSSPEGTADWQWIESFPGEDLFAVEGGQLGFGAFGRGGLSQTSEDGAVSWSIRAYNGAFDLRDAIAVDDGWIAVGTNGLTSIVREHTAGNPTVNASFDLEAITYSGALLVAAGKNKVSGEGGLFISRDLGITWIDAERVKTPIHDLLWDGTRFIGCGERGLITVSSDAKSWTTSVVLVNESFIAIIECPDAYIALGAEGGVFRSSDLKRWTKQATIRGRPSALAYSAGTYVVVGKSGGIWISRDTRSWSRISPGYSNDLHGVAADHGFFVAVGDAGLILRSSDGRVWTREFEGLPGGFWHAKWTGTRFIVVDWWGAFLSSIDGLHWTRQEVPSGSPQNAIPFPGGYLCLDSQGGTSWITVDEVNWESHASNHENGSIWDTVWFRDRFISVGRDGKLQSSVDGFSWSPQTSFTQEGLYSITYGDGKLVAGGESGQVYVSEDGTSWQARPGSALGWITRLESTPQWGFIGLTYGGIVHSQDGVAWTTINLLQQVPAWGFFVAGDRVIVVGYQGKIVSSSDLITWTPENSGTTNLLVSGAASPNCILAVGNNGTVLRRL